MLNGYRPLVSIITPTYNHEQFIVPCVESVLGQTYGNWEQIVIDDGSSDHTADRMSRFSDPRIRYVHQPNQGPFNLAHTYNKALALARGELTAVLEGDDFWPADKLEALVPAFLDVGVVLAYGEAADTDPAGNQQRVSSRMTRLRRGLPPATLFNDPVGSATAYMASAEGRSLVGASTVMIRRTALDQIGGFQHVPGFPLTDLPTFMELSLAGRFFYSGKTLGYRRRHPRSVTLTHLQLIHRMACEFTLQFLDAHRDHAALSSLSRAGLQRNWKEAEYKMWFSDARLFLVQRKWSEARAHFREALKSGDLLVRLASRLGVLCSYAGIDLEFAMKLAGRADLAPDRRADSKCG